MAQQSVRQIFSFPEYVLLEDMSTVKHEFLAGEVWAMAGGTPEHAAIAGNMIGLLGAALRGKRCRVYTSDLRIRVPASGLGTYPDASVICGEVQLDPEDAKGHTAMNPIVLVEVLSPSTEDYDRGEKMDHYKQIPSLRDVLLIAHDRRCVELWHRDQTGWSHTTVTSPDVVEVTSLGLTLSLDEIYFDPLAG